MEVRYLPFNINDWVRVKLTEHGRNILYHENLRINAFIKERNSEAVDIPFHLNEDAEGWSHWQLWSLMARFGSTMSMVTPLPFASDIELEVKE